MNKLYRNVLLTALVVSAMVIGNAFAGTATANMGVSANVTASCEISASALGFGSYDPVSANSPGGADATTTANLSVLCTAGSTATITLDQGLTPGGGSSDALPQRQMTNGSNQLIYNIYQDSGHTTIWGNTPDTGVSYEGTGTPTNVTVFGIAPRGQAVPQGTYNDIVVATITF